MNRIEKLAIFCGAYVGNCPSYKSTAENLATFLCEAGIEIVYGGAKIGLMGAIADKALSLGGKVTGVMPQSLANYEIAHQQLSAMHIVNSMHERKVLMTELSDGFITIPGGIGSLDEFFEVYTLLKLQMHHKPCAILNTNGFYNPLIQQLDIFVREGFLKQADRDLIIIAEEPENLVQQILQYAPGHHELLTA